jgi:hypothetical protein
MAAASVRRGRACKRSKRRVGKRVPAAALINFSHGGLNCRFRVLIISAGTTCTELSAQRARFLPVPGRTGSGNDAAHPVLNAALPTPTWGHPLASRGHDSGPGVSPFAFRTHCRAQRCRRRACTRDVNGTVSQVAYRRLRSEPTHHSTQRKADVLIALREPRSVHDGQP